jgi:hypothetical protein
MAVVHWLWVGTWAGAGQLVEFTDFVDVMVELMTRHAQIQQQQGEQTGEWFVMYFDDEPNSLPLYYNTLKRSMT